MSRNLREWAQLLVQEQGEELCGCWAGAGLGEFDKECDDVTTWKGSKWPGIQQIRICLCNGVGCQGQQCWGEEEEKNYFICH